MKLSWSKAAQAPCLPRLYRVNQHVTLAEIPRNEPAAVAPALARPRGLHYSDAMTRIGFGYDSHRLVKGRPLILGGVRIDYELGLSGHSDGDAVLHAVTDAILGAMAEGDIGQWFPDSDPRWEGAAGDKFVSTVVAAARTKGYVVGNCDIVILAEAPKLSAHRDAMRRQIADLLGVEPDRVGVKAKTNEKMGFVGRGEGIVAMATVLLTSAGQ